MALTIKKSKYGSSVGCLQLGSIAFHSIAPDHKAAKIGLIKLLEGDVK